MPVQCTIFRKVWGGIVFEKFANNSATFAKDMRRVAS